MDNKIISNEHSDLTLVIDGNWLLMSRLVVLSNTYIGDTQLMMKKIKQLLCRSINSMLHQFPEIDNIIFVADGGSWRDSIEQPESVKKYHINYKGQRQKSNNINWDIVWKEYSDFIDMLNKSSNITVTRCFNVEGDDWCWWWSTMLNKDNTNVIIWSADRDLTQLVKTDNNSGFFTVTLYTRGKNTILTEQASEINDGYDIIRMFGNPHWQFNSSLLNKIENMCSAVRKINPELVILDKIFRGDVSDNIFPAIKRTSSSGKEYKMSEKMLYDFNGDVTNDEDISYYINEIYDTKQFKGKTTYTQTDALERALYNRSLVMMNDKYYPSYIIDKIKENGSYYNKTKDISATEQRIDAQSININDEVSTQNNNMEDFLNLL